MSAKERWIYRMALAAVLMYSVTVAAGLAGWLWVALG